MRVATSAADLDASGFFLEPLKGRGRVTPEIAIRLEKAFGSSAQSWYLLQAFYDLAEAQQRSHEIDAQSCVQAA